MLLKISKTNPQLGALIVADLSGKVKVEWGNETLMDIGDGVVLSSSSSIIRYMARSFARLNLYPSDPLSRTEVDHYLTLSTGPLSNDDDEFDKAVLNIESAIPSNFLVDQAITAADYAVFGALYGNNRWKNLKVKTISDWFNLMSQRQEVKKIITALPQDVKFVPKKRERESPVVAECGGLKKGKGGKTTKSDQPKQTKDEGKFVDLPGAEIGKVIVRFPPEASGYLHIGHAKAVLLNQYYRDMFKGKLILRFDDTNPAKEKEEFEHVILDDLKMLDVKYDHFSRTSDHFETMLNYCEKLIKEGKAYVDDSDPETMKAQRDAREESKCRSNSVEKNLSMWEEMKKGTEKGQKCAVRAKIDMKSHNGALRDPTIYRCKPESHPATGDKYKVYPTYDFACPVVDSIEGVTHALRTTEYMDRDDQYFWFINALGLRKPFIYAYSRLSMTNTVMSKRKLTWFVESGLVDGWDDPRFPTVRGVLRRGLTIEALKQFILAQGSSRSVVFMEWDKIWALNKKVIDPIAPRYTTVDLKYNVPVHISGVKEESVQVDKHPKNADIGQKTIWRGPKILIDGADAETLKEGENATFINWGNIKITKVHRNGNRVTSVDAVPNLEDKDFKKTLKVTWLADVEKDPLTPTICIHYDHKITKPVLDKDDDFKDYIGQNTKCEIETLGDPELKYLKQGDIIQVQRKGFFIVDSPYKPLSPNTCKPTPIFLIAIPDGTPSSYGPPGKSSVTATSNATPAKSNKNNKKEAKEAPQSSSNKLSTPSSADEASRLHIEITTQGNKVRALKAEKADKDTISGAVKVLLDLKAKFKEVHGQDWKPDMTFEPKATANAESDDAQIESIYSQIKEQGDKIRKMKSEKADKEAIGQAVKVLLELKAKFKEASGKDWTPDLVLSPKSNTSSPVDDSALYDQVTEQGDKVRKLKSEKAAKEAINEEVKILLELKTKYKEKTGQDYKPGAKPVSQTIKSESSSNAVASKGEDPLQKELLDRIAQQGDLVRKLKTEKADKADIDANVKILLDLKAKFKEKFGIDPPQSSGQSKNSKKEKTPQKANKGGDSGKKNQKQNQASKPDATGPGHKITRLGMEAKKEDNLADWYSQLIVKAELLEYYDVSGCYILRPWAFSIWEAITSFFDREIKKFGVANCYFPMFVSQAALQKEKDHIADFAPEVAWVTKSGSTDLAEPIAVRPTSETVMYPTFAKWIQSYRDLPIKVNQWCNVVRWEFKQPQPFLRTREFLWQEGHTAYAHKPEAEEEVLQILDLYRAVYEDLLAIPVIRGRKTEKEKFAGGEYTTTTEAYIAASGRAIQGATSHHLGQNFSKMFEIVYEDPETGEKKYVYQNSWGITTRTIGVLCMVHGDNQGLVLPPRVAMIQVVIVPCGITANLKEEDRKVLYQACEEYEKSLKEAGIRVKGDYRENYSPGWKFNHWELKGVPIRLELGPRDVSKGEYVAVRRDLGSKLVKSKATLVEDIKNLLETIQNDLFNKAKKERDEHLSMANNWTEFVGALDRKHIILAPFCGVAECEEQIKENSKCDVEVEPGAPSMGAKSLCCPFDQPKNITSGMKCIRPDCKEKPIIFTLFGRSY